MKTLIALTGGIGAGKSVVARMLRTMGYPVFDCDIEARVLMDADTHIKARIAGEIAEEAITADGSIDRARLAAIVFADEARLATLNAIVHGAVKERLAQWAAAQQSPVVFVETAILYQSGLNRAVDAEWRVEAPDALRIERVMARNGISREAVQSRIDSQNHTPAPGEPQPPVSVILNDGIEPVLPQVLRLTQQATKQK